MFTNKIYNVEMYNKCILKKFVNTNIIISFKENDSFWEDGSDFFSEELLNQFDDIEKHNYRILLILLFLSCVQ